MGASDNIDVVVINGVGTTVTLTTTVSLVGGGAAKGWLLNGAVSAITSSGTGGFRVLVGNTPVTGTFPAGTTAMMFPLYFKGFKDMVGKQGVRAATVQILTLPNTTVNGYITIDKDND